MESDELKNLWQAYDARLEQSLQLNIQVLEKIESRKVDSSFRSTVRFKIFGIVFTFCWNAFLALVLYIVWPEPFFVGSLIALMGLNFLAAWNYYRQVKMIRALNWSAPVTDTQQQLSRLHISVIRNMQMIWLQLPLYFIFWMKPHMFVTAGLTFWLIQGSCIALSVAATVWLFRNISVKNAHSKLVKSLIWGDGGKAIEKAHAYIRKIDAFRQENGAAENDQRTAQK